MYLLNKNLKLVKLIVPMYTLKPRKEEPKKLRTNSLFFKMLYPLDKNQCQAVSGKCSELKDIQISAEADFDSIY